MASFLFPLLPHDASAHGHHVDAVLRFLIVSTGTCFAIMAAILLVSVVFHRGRGRTARYTHGNRRRDRMAAALAGAVVLFGIDAVAVVRSAGALRSDFWAFPDADPRAVRVEVTAQQWAWTFRYPGADGVFATPDDIVTLNELRVPVDRPVTLQLTSKDVVHAMYLPNFRTKVDAIPGTVTRMWFAPREVGTFEIGCAQHCGAWHYKMRGELTVMAGEGFGRWLERAGADAALRVTAAAAAGTGTAATAAAAAAAAADTRASLSDGWTWNGAR
jgi:cytochrome c oxidase subunit II